MNTRTTRTPAAGSTGLSGLASTLQRAAEHAMRRRLLAEFVPGSSSTIRGHRVTRHTDTDWEVDSLDRDFYDLDEAVARLLD